MNTASRIVEDYVRVKVPTTTTVASYSSSEYSYSCRPISRSKLAAAAAATATAAEEDRDAMPVHDSDSWPDSTSIFNAYCSTVHVSCLTPERVREWESERKGWIG